MRIELNGKRGLRLRRGQTLKVLDGDGTTVCAEAGTLWLTEADRPRDVILDRGACHRLGRGVAVIEALGEASVSFA